MGVLHEPYSGVYGCRTTTMYHPGSTATELSREGLSVQGELWIISDCCIFCSCYSQILLLVLQATVIVRGRRHHGHGHAIQPWTGELVLLLCFFSFVWLSPCCPSSNQLSGAVLPSAMIEGRCETAGKGTGQYGRWVLFCYCVLLSASHKPRQRPTGRYAAEWGHGPQPRD